MRYGQVLQQEGQRLHYEVISRLSENYAADLTLLIRRFCSWTRGVALWRYQQSK